MNQIDVKLYDDSLKECWDSFVEKSRNGTFLFLRDYMDYHADRFEDHSLLFYSNNDLLALLPGNISSTTFYSHEGLTYGGLVISEKTSATQVLNIFEVLLEYLRSLKRVTKMIYRPVPHFYHQYPSEEDLYALYRVDAKLIERKISSVIPLNHPYKFSTLRNRKRKKADKQNFALVNDTDFSSFWNVLDDTLSERHQTHPVHSLAEMSRLNKSFPDNILLYRVISDKETIAGCVLYVMKQVVHVQYIASNDFGRRMGALDWMFDILIHKIYAHKTFFDFGISVEQGGKYLNEGLIFQKEGFGGRAIVYDVYGLTL